MQIAPNKLYWDMRDYLEPRVLLPKPQDRVPTVIVNEGSSRSGKSYCMYQLGRDLALDPTLPFFKNGFDMYVYRNTLKSAREDAFNADFKKCMIADGTWDEKNVYSEKVAPEYKVGNSVIKFRGVDGGIEKSQKDILFVNEALDISDEGIFDDLMLRITLFSAFDFNPKLTDHPIFNWEGRPNHLFTKTTWIDNRYISNTEKLRILSTCPWDFKDYDFATRTWRVAEEYRTPHPVNTKFKTANRWRWLVYGEGVRCPQDGAVFPNINWIDSFPEDCEEVYFGLDFGYYKDPTALVKVGRRGMEMFIEYLVYEPISRNGEIAKPEDLFWMVKPHIQAEIDRRKKGYNSDRTNIDIFCDSAATDIKTGIDFVSVMDEMRSSFGEYDYQFWKVKKKGLIAEGIATMSRFGINIVKNPNARKEFENYTRQKNSNGSFIERYTEINNHGIDAARYVVIETFGDYINTDYAH